MLRKTKKTVEGVALVSVVVFATAAAGFNATWTFLPGGAVTATATEPIIGEDIQTGSFATCDTSVVKATAKSGSGLSGGDLVSIDEINFSDSTTDDGRCPTATGGASTLIPLGLPWKFSAQSYDVATGTTKGVVTGVSVRSESSDGCVVTWARPGGAPGEVYISYTNSTGEIRIEEDGRNGSNLIAVDTRDCNPNDVSPGDQLRVSGAYVPDPLQKVTSP
ncbi:hypothetical protein SMC26_04700 [Actinomadura fulvescens]|uniref:Secreted protein n=1 Tax=Actinomadura fulvescens TaxID=46160 RepID=A0ABP6C3C0_9ACTN